MGQLENSLDDFRSGRFRIGMFLYGELFHSEDRSIDIGDRIRGRLDINIDAENQRSVTPEFQVGRFSTGGCIGFSAIFDEMFFEKKRNDLAVEGLLKSSVRAISARLIAPSWAMRLSL